LGADPQLLRQPGLAHPIEDVLLVLGRIGRVDPIRSAIPLTVLAGLEVQHLGNLRPPDSLLEAVPA